MSFPNSHAWSCLLFCLISISSSFAAKSATPVPDFFVGEWDIERSKISVPSGAQIGPQVRGHFSIKSQGGVINGSYYENTTGPFPDRVNTLALKIDSLSATTGGFYVSLVGSEEDSDDEETIVPLFAVHPSEAHAAADPEDMDDTESDDAPAAKGHMHRLFDYHFEQHNNGIYTAHGRWQGLPRGMYQLSVIGTSAFTLTIYPDSADTKNHNTAFVVWARRHGEAKTASMLQRFGPTALIVGLFIVQRALRSSKAFQPKPPATARRARVAAAAGASEGTQGAGAREADDKRD